MGTSTWSGPIKAGSIKDTSGTTLGKDVKNTGFALMVQSVDITQADIATAAKTGIVIPANSQIVNIKVMTNAIFSGASANISLGVSATATELVAATALSAVGALVLTPGTNATLVNKWNNIGTTDIAIWALAANTGTGTTRLIVEYIQANN
jgi:hypothetical protein